jgi:protein disulfide-isomerase A6
VVKLTKDNFKKLVLEGDELWLVEFFAPWCGHCKTLAPAWEKAAKTLKGVVKIGAVDMTSDQDVGQPYGIQGFPTLKFFGFDKKSPQDY